MPLVHVTTSAEFPAPEARASLMRGLSRTVSEHFGKPEKWVMTALAPRTQMTFGGSEIAACYVEVKSIGTLESAQAQALSEALCAQLAKGLAVAPDRIYIEFTNATGPLWGWNGTTFG